MQCTRAMYVQSAALAKNKKGTFANFPFRVAGNLFQETEICPNKYIEFYNQHRTRNQNIAVYNYLLQKLVRQRIGFRDHKAVKGAFTNYVCIQGWVGGQKNARFTT